PHAQRTRSAERRDGAGGGTAAGRTQWAVHRPPALRQDARLAAAGTCVARGPGRGVPAPAQLSRFPPAGPVGPPGHLRPGVAGPSAVARARRGVAGLAVRGRLAPAAYPLVNA